jgi:hypothetical protein
VEATARPQRAQVIDGIAMDPERRGDDVHRASAQDRNRGERSIPVAVDEGGDRLVERPVATADRDHLGTVVRELRACAVEILERTRGRDLVMASDQLGEQT